MDEHGHFCWNELMSWDVEKDKAFYAAAIGWNFEPMPMPQGGTYWIAKMGEKPVAGLFPMPEEECAGIPANWLPYLAVDDVEARVERAVAAGATLMRPIFPVPDVGRIALLTEPGGAAIAWMTPTPPAA